MIEDESFHPLEQDAWGKNSVCGVSEHVAEKPASRGGGKCAHAEANGCDPCGQVSSASEPRRPVRLASSRSNATRSRRGDQGGGRDSAGDHGLLGPHGQRGRCKGTGKPRPTPALGPRNPDARQHHGRRSQRAAGHVNTGEKVPFGGERAGRPKYTGDHPDPPRSTFSRNHTLFTRGDPSHHAREHGARQASHKCFQPQRRQRSPKQGTYALNQRWICANPIRFRRRIAIWPPAQAQPTGFGPHHPLAKVGIEGVRQQLRTSK